MSDLEEALENAECPLCEQQIEPGVPVFIRDGKLWHLPGSPHCVRCERCGGRCLKPYDHGA